MSDINSLSPDFRDWLLNRNIVADTVSDAGLSSRLRGIGHPAEVETTPTSVQPSDDLEDIGDFYLDINVVNNLYQGDDDDYREANVENIPIENFSNLGRYWIEDANLASDHAVWRNGDIIKNLFQSEQDRLLVDLRQETSNFDPGTTAKGSYLDTNGQLNNLGASTQPLDVLGSLLTRGNVGFTPDGPEPNYDIRGSLAGRALNTQNGIQDTNLGIIGRKELTNHLGYNATFNLQEETIGRINTNVLSLLKGNNVIVPNYQITVPKGKLGKVLDFGARVLGFEIPFSLLADSSSIFANYDSNNVANIERMESMVDNTGRGQVLALIANLNQNKYRPQFDDGRKKKKGEAESGDKGTNGELYAFGTVDGKVQDLLNVGGTFGDMLSGDFTTTELKGGFNDDFDKLSGLDVGLGADGKTKFSWGDTRNNKTAFEYYDDEIFKVKKGLLHKTQELFKTDKMNLLVSGKARQVTNPNLEIETPKIVNGANFLSKGSAVLSEFAVNNTSGVTNDNVFCRVWTTFDKYNQVKDLQKHRDLDKFGKDLKGNKNMSVLDDNGFAKVSPYSSDKPDVKKYMFSLENLAWHDYRGSLPQCEQGPGDVLTGARGRIMWFPPYEMGFTDTSTVEWEANKFIGRGEPLYTYNNTERKGTLSWKIIIDHNTYQNNMVKGGKSDDYMVSFNAGCIDEVDPKILQNLSTFEKYDIEVKQKQETKKVTNTNKVQPLEGVSVFFPNDSASILDAYEDGDGTGLGTTQGEGIVAKYIKTSGSHKIGSPYIGKYDDTTDYGLNVPFLDAELIDRIVKFMKIDAPTSTIKITGYVSRQGNPDADKVTNDTNQKELALLRANNVRDYLISGLGSALANSIDAGIPIPNLDTRIRANGGGVYSISSQPDIENKQDLKEFKEARRVNIEFDVGGKEDEKEAAKNAPKTETDDSKTLRKTITDRFINECDYFKKLEQDDKFVFETLKDKLQYFHPAFHSTTPEGFNSRLTFLKQCTRQGPTDNPDGNANNLAFGRPPICILRIGDFYHTKIAIDNVSLSFDPLVWDLNPEGVGVQPMIATVDMSFSFLGGSSLAGPINKLQNALSFNYFANTELFDPRADRIKNKSIVDGYLSKYDPNKQKEEDKDASNDGGTDVVVDQAATAEEIAAQAEENAADDKELLTNNNPPPSFEVTYAGGGNITATYRINASNGTGLTKDYDAKLQFHNKDLQWEDVATGTILGKDNGDDLLIGSATFRGFSENLTEENVEFHVVRPFEASNVIGHLNFRVFVPEIGGNATTKDVGWLHFDCLDWGLEAKTSFLSVSDTASINADPCAACYSVPYRKYQLPSEDKKFGRVNPLRITNFIPDGLKRKSRKALETIVHICPLTGTTS